MPDPLPSCFSGSSAGPPPSSTSSGPTLITSVYSTPLGPVALSWSRTVLGLLLRLDLRLSSDNDEDGDIVALKIRPWLLFSRRGSRRSRRRSRSLLLSWDLSRATFPSSGGPEPFSGYFVSLAVDGQIMLVAGDLADLAFKRMKINRNTTTTAAADFVNSKAALMSRREHVAMGEEGRSCYRTLVRFGGKERSITIDLGGEMKLEVDGERVLQIRRLRWKFRGSERVEVDGGDRIQISWDLHSWIFPPKDGLGDDDVSGRRSAVFVFRFENEENETLGGGGGGGYFGNMNESSGENDDKKRSLHKTSSSSSSSSSSASSSAGSWTVMEWASTEEKELRGREGFSLVVHAWKS